jgi:hypothetical protein
MAVKRYELQFMSHPDFGAGKHVVVLASDYDALHMLASEMAEYLANHHSVEVGGHCGGCNVLAKWEAFNAK